MLSTRFPNFVSEKKLLIRVAMEQDFKTNINCGSCVRAVTPRMQQLKGLLSWKVDTDHPDKVLHVEMEHDIAAAVIEAVQNAGFQIQSV